MSFAVEFPSRFVKPFRLNRLLRSVALEPVGDSRALEARWLIAHALPPLRRAGMETAMTEPEKKVRLTALSHGAG